MVSATGWSSQTIQSQKPSATGLNVGEGSEDRLFSPDLSLGLVEPLTATLLSSEASEGTIYLRDDTSGGYLPLVTAANTPAGTKLDENTPFGVVKYNVSFVGCLLYTS